MRTLHTIISTLLGVLLAAGVFAEKPESTMFYLNSKNDYYKANFTLVSHLMVLTFSVNGSDSLNLIFDTGAGRTIITEISNPYVVSLNEARKVKLRGLGTNESVDGLISKNNKLSMGKIEGKAQELLVVPNKVIDLTAQVGHPINGVIGRTIFEQFIVEINYTEHTINFYDPDKFNRKIRKDEDIIPIELIEGKPYITATTTINGVDIPVKLLFDTGMSFALWLDPSTNPNIKPGSARRQEIIGQGLNGNLSGEVSRVEKFKIGRYEFSNVITAFPDSIAIRDAITDNRRNGSVGAEIFRRFNVLIDYRNQQIILRKNSNFGDPFRYDMSGIEVGAIVEGLPYYKIISVGANTPASECGLQVNDEIKSINGIPANTMKISDITNILKSKEGKTIYMRVIRNSREVKVKFKLQELI